jgi:hypothetical protein
LRTARRATRNELRGTQRTPVAKRVPIATNPTRLPATPRPPARTVMSRRSGHRHPVTRHVRAVTSRTTSSPRGGPRASVVTATSPPLHRRSRSMRNVRAAMLRTTRTGQPPRPRHARVVTPTSRSSTGPRTRASTVTTRIRARTRPPSRRRARPVMRRSRPPIPPMRPRGPRACLAIAPTRSRLSPSKRSARPVTHPRSNSRRPTLATVTVQPVTAAMSTAKRLRRRAARATRPSSPRRLLGTRPA